MGLIKRPVRRIDAILTDVIIQRAIIVCGIVSAHYHAVLRGFLILGLKARV
jgi:hypothetical protein